MFLFYFLTLEPVSNLLKRLFSGNKHNRTLKKIHKKIWKAHFHLDRGRHHHAKKLYNEIEDHYRELPKEHKAKVYAKSMELHKKLRYH